MKTQLIERLEAFGRRATVSTCRGYVKGSVAGAFGRPVNTQLPIGLAEYPLAFVTDKGGVVEIATVKFGKLVVDRVPRGNVLSLQYLN